MTRPPFRAATVRAVSVVGLALGLAAVPVTFDIDRDQLTWQRAFAEKGGNGGGSADHGGGNDRDHDRGRGHDARGLDGDHGNGKAFGQQDRDDPRVVHAKERYRSAAGQAAGDDPPGQGDDRAAHRYSASETRQLIERGWRARASTDGFRNHGERVRTMVELAKRLGYGSRVGSLQANFGTPQENGITALQAQLEEAQIAVAAGGPEAEQRVDDLSAALADAIADAKPGNSPDDDWATADLDVNGDGVVDQSDLDALDDQTVGTGEDEASPGGDEEPTGG
jgi:hypothetical protein